MKWSLATALFAAPLALASALQADLVERTTGKDAPKGDVYQKGNKNEYGNGATVVVVEQVVLIWACNGGGEKTTTHNTVATAASAGAPAATHTVVVGGSAGLVYTPESLNAAVGDMVVFTFLSQNHTVTQSPFSTPCKPLAGGMDTGFMANPNNTVNPPPQLAMQVKVATPLWFFCGQKSHCGKGMVFSINPAVDKTQEMFKQMAIAQNGTGSTAAIVATAPPAGAATSAPVVVTTEAAPVPSPTSPSEVAPPPPASTGQIATGSGVTPGGEACSCSCFCGVSSFPLAGQGIAGYGGISGSIPMALKA